MIPSQRFAFLACDWYMGWNVDIDLQHTGRLTEANRHSTAASRVNLVILGRALHAGEYAVANWFAKRRHDCL